MTIALQLVGQRMEEEKVLEGVRIIVEAVQADGALEIK